MRQDNYSRRKCVRAFRPSKSFYSESDKGQWNALDGGGIWFVVFQWYELMALTEMNASVN